MLLLSAEQASRVQALAKEILETLEKSHHISLDAPKPAKPAAPAAHAVEVVRKKVKRSRKNRKRLTEQQVAFIRNALKDGVSRTDLAREHGTTYATISKIANNLTYKSASS